MIFDFKMRANIRINKEQETGSWTDQMRGHTRAAPSIPLCQIEHSCVLTGVCLLASCHLRSCFITWLFVLFSDTVGKERDELHFGFELKEVKKPRLKSDLV